MFDITEYFSQRQTEVFCHISAHILLLNESHIDINENRCRMFTIHASYLVGPVFRSWLTDRLTWWRLWVVFPNLCGGSPGKCKVIRLHKMTACGRNGGIAPFIFNISTKGMRSATRPSHFTVGGIVRGIHWIWNLVSLRGGIDTLDERCITLPCKKFNNDL